MRPRGDGNRQVVLTNRPVGEPATSDFELVESPVPEPKGGEVLVRALWLSLDPYMRGRMRDAPSYAPPVTLGEVMTGAVVGRVVESNKEGLAPGDIVEGRLGWQDYAATDGSNVRTVDPGLGPLTTALGVLGMTGLTAYFGFFDVARPRPGDTVVVSAASGAVGQVVGQLAKLAGCHAVGIAGTPEKIDFITNELGYDAGINYRTDDLDEALAKACPGGVDVYFDNVGGAVSEAVFRHLAERARISVCGQISQYNLVEPDLAPRDHSFLVRKRASMEGFLVWDFAHRAEEARRRLARWLHEGALTHKEDVVEGLENAPEAFIGMLRGENFGKLLVKIADEADQ